MLTGKEIAAIRAREQAAALGPWEWSHYRNLPIKVKG